MKKNILVTGDYIVDHHILKGLKSEASEDGKTGSTIVKTHGGAYMTFSLMEKVVPMLNSHKQEEKDMVNLAWGMNVDVKTLMSEGTIHDSYLQWSLDCVGKDNKEYFRLKEKLGFGNLPDNSKIKWLEPAAITNKLTNTVAILDEANLGFRNTPKAWPDFTKACRIILKTTQPLCKGELWTRLLEKKDQLVTIVSLQQLKHYNIKVSNDISWEQTALDITTGLTEHRDLNALMQSGTLIVTIGSAGALIIVNGTKEKFAEFTLVFDPETMENEWEMQKAEKIINLTGLGSSFLAGFSLWYAHSDFNVTDAVKAGLNMVNSSLINGLFNSYAPPFIYNDHSGAFNSTIEKRRYVSAFIPSPYWKSLGTNPPNHEWTILENNYDVNKPQKNKKKRLPLFSLAQSLAVHGTDNIKYAPLLQMGDVVTFDRVEIEGLRNIRKQVEFFVTFEKGTKPLNIAVFGPPGAGKSFIVKALAKSLFKNTHIVPEFLTFNLSQFRDSAGLPGAFHAIRDAVLNGKLPIVFWDEFDTDNYKWLKTMLAPMQDGVFQDAQETHPIGKAIFIFAGGVTYTMEHFVENTKKKDSAELKIPDFLSRIQCYLNVLGPNKRPVKKRKVLAKARRQNRCMLPCSEGIVYQDHPWERESSFTNGSAAVESPA